MEDENKISDPEQLSIVAIAHWKTIPAIMRSCIGYRSCDIPIGSLMFPIPLVFLEQHLDGIILINPKTNKPIEDPKMVQCMMLVNKKTYALVFRVEYEVKQSNKGQFIGILSNYRTACDGNVGDFGGILARHDLQFPGMMFQERTRDFIMLSTICRGLDYINGDLTLRLKKSKPMMKRLITNEEFPVTIPKGGDQCVIVWLDSDHLGVAKRIDKKRMEWLKMSSTHQLVVDNNFKPTIYNPINVLAEGQFMIGGLCDKMVETCLQHPRCVHNKSYFLELLSGYLKPISYQFLWTKLIEDNNNNSSRPIKKLKKTSSGLVGLTTPYLYLIMSFVVNETKKLYHFTQENHTIPLLLNILLVSKTLYQNKSSLFSKFSLSVQLSHLSNIMDCDPRCLTLCLESRAPQNFRKDDLKILQTMPSLRNLQLHGFSEVSLESLVQIEILSIEGWKDNCKLPKNLIDLSIDAKYRVSRFNGDYSRLQMLSISGGRKISKGWNILSEQFPSLTKLDLSECHNISNLEIPSTLRVFHDVRDLFQPPMEISVFKNAQQNIEVITDICISYNNPIESDIRFPRLTQLHCEGYLLRNLGCFQSLQLLSLRDLQIVHGKFRTLEYINNLPQLEIGKFLYCYELEDISQLSSLSHLTELHLIESKKIVDFSSLLDIVSLRVIHYTQPVLHLEPHTIANLRLHRPYMEVVSH